MLIKHILRKTKILLLKIYLLGPTFPRVTNFALISINLLGTAANVYPLSFWNRSFFGLTESFFLTILILKKQGSLSITPVEIASTTTPEKFKSQKHPIILSFGQRSHVVIVTPLLSKSFVFSMFPSTLKRHSSGLKSVFVTVVTQRLTAAKENGRPNHRNKAEFSIFFSGVLIYLATSFLAL